MAEHLLLSAGVVEVIAGRTQGTTRPAGQKIDAIAAIFRDLTALCTDSEFPTLGPLTRLEWILPLPGR